MAKKEMPQQLLTVNEVAEVMQISPMSVYRLIHSGELKSIKLGRCSFRIRPADLDAFFDCCETVRPAAPEPVTGNGHASLEELCK